MTVNLADAVVIGILALCLMEGSRKGLARSIFGLCRSVISLGLANTLYPHVTKLLRDSSGLNDYIKQLVTNRLGLAASIPEQTLRHQTALIHELPVPKVIADMLLGGNNAELYRIFNAHAVEDYIVSYIANTMINAISLSLVFAIVYGAMRWISRGLNKFNKIPVIGPLNKLGGAACGLLLGTIGIWFVFAFAALFFMRPPVLVWINYIENSLVAGWLYENNIIMDMITKIVL